LVATAKPFRERLHGLFSFFGRSGQHARQDLFHEIEPASRMVSIGNVVPIAASRWGRRKRIDLDIYGN
jgi:hypothetical protein